MSVASVANLDRVRIADVFAEARRVSARAVAEKCGAELRGGGARGWARARTCPLCDGVEDFSVCSSGWRCHKCGRHGDGIALWAAFAGCSPLAAACELAGVDPAALGDGDPASSRPGPARPAPARPAPPRSVPARPAARSSLGAERARALWARSAPASGTIVERYLARRGVAPRVAAAAARVLRFLPDAPWWDTGGGPARVTPAMLAAAITPAGEITGVHVTHLSPDGTAKAELRPAKKMHGRFSDGAARPLGVLLIAPPPGGPVVVAEGIENALAGATLLGGPCGAFAALSLDRLQGGLGRGPWGGVDWRRPHPCPDAPAATIPFRGQVIIVVDHDMSPLSIDAGSRWARVISPTRRAQISGVLAAHWWRQAGASEVKVMLPPPGLDAAYVAVAEARAHGG